MLFNYLFLSYQFNVFAKQSEWISELLFNRNKSTHLQALSTKPAVYRYLNYRESMAYDLIDFERETNSVSGWLKSFIPGTNAFSARSKVAKQLIDAKHLYLEISVSYYQTIKMRTNVMIPQVDKKQVEKKHKKPANQMRIDRQEEPILTDKNQAWVPTMSLFKR